jgi:hypothetical protein
MGQKRLLFISGSVGLGHVTRDLALARALRQTLPHCEILWLAAPPASEVLKKADEFLLPAAAEWSDESLAGAERSGQDAAGESGDRILRVEVLALPGAVRAELCAGHHRLGIPDVRQRDQKALARIAQRISATMVDHYLISMMCSEQIEGQLRQHALPHRDFG